jgi:aspartate kinase
VTTLGRGGTDATAVALAASLDASCEIYSDVAGVFTADPRIVPDARKLTVVSYGEMLEMAASGARVLMLRAVELARANGVRLHARSTFSDEPGTWVQERAEGVELPPVRAVTHSDDDVLFTVRGLEGVSSAAVLRAAAAEHVSVDTIVVGGGRDGAGLSFSVAAEDVPATRRAVERAGEAPGLLEVEESDDLGRVSVVGAGMRSRTGVAAHMLRALADVRVEPRLISTSPIKISCLVNRVEVEKSVRALHDAFRLGDAESGPGD